MRRGGSEGAGRAGSRTAGSHEQAAGWGGICGGTWSRRRCNSASRRRSRPQLLLQSAITAGTAAFAAAWRGEPYTPRLASRGPCFCRRSFRRSLWHPQSIGLIAANLHDLTHERIQEILRSQANLSEFVCSPGALKPSVRSASCAQPTMGAQPLVQHGFCYIPAIGQEVG